MYRPNVLLMDAVTAVMMIECSGNPLSLVGVPSALQSDFPIDPDGDHHEAEQVILTHAPSPLAFYFLFFCEKTKQIVFP